MRSALTRFALGFIVLGAATAALLWLGAVPIRWLAIVLTGSPRSASVVAFTDAIVYEVGREAFEPFIQARPENVELGHILATRSDVLADLQSHQDKLTPNGALAVITDRIRAFF